MNKIEAYKEIQQVLIKHRDLLSGDSGVDIERSIEQRIAVQEISDEFGIYIPHCFNSDFCKLSEYQFIAIYGADYSRNISWSDDGKQPENERLYVISFPTGPYIFGASYPINTFRAFFEELREYGPKYADTANKNLYFTKETARFVHNNFNRIYEKYKKQADKEVKEKKIKSLQEELEKLSEEDNS